MGTAECSNCGLGNSRGAVYLIAIMDVVLSLILFLLSIVALGDLKKVAGLLERETTYEMSEPDYIVESRDEWMNEAGRHENDNLHGGIVLFLINVVVTLLLAVGLLFGVQKDMDCPVKTWLIYGCTIVLLGVITLLVMTVATGQPLYLCFLSAVLIRIYEMWVVFDYLKNYRFTFNPTLLTRTGSTERLHSV